MESCRPLMNKTRGPIKGTSSGVRSFGFSEGGEGTPASPAAFAETFAQAALGPAAFAETFAQAAQVPRYLPERLRRSRWVPRHLPERLRRSRWVPRHLPERLRRSRWVPQHLPRRLRRSRKSRGICRDVCASRASSKIFIGACLFVDNGRPIYGSPRANQLMACSMSPPKRSAKRMTSTFSVSSVVYARYSSRETSVA